MLLVGFGWATMLWNLVVWVWRFVFGLWVVFVVDWWCVVLLGSFLLVIWFRFGGLRFSGF